jgi:biopolymer transport protein ExbB
MLHELFAQLQDVDSIRQAAAQAAQVATTAPAEKSISVWELLSYGGWYIMGPLGIMSLLALYILIERVMGLSKARRLDGDFMHRIRDYVHSNKLDSARTLCDNSPSPVARVIGKGVARIGQPSKEIEQAMEGAGRMEVSRLERGIGLSDNISVGIISKGLYQKMVTSAAGLIVGIVSFTAYYIVNNLVERVVEKIDGTGQEFLELLRETPKA